MMPPSPSSLASMMNNTYLTVTTQMRDQMIIETAGTTICSADAPAWRPFRRHSRKA